jgi:predicted DNA binding CopG/RHH family protein
LSLLGSRRNDQVALHFFKKSFSWQDIHNRLRFKASVIADVHKGQEKHLALRVQRSSLTACHQKQPGK